MTQRLDVLAEEPPRNEPVLQYEPGSPELTALQAELRALAASPTEAAMWIGSEVVRSDDTFELYAPHDHVLHLATVHQADAEHVRRAIAAATEASRAWATTPFEERAADFLRFNVHFAARIHREQPISTEQARNRLDYRPLDGFVLAITPFNVTAIAGNLPSAPALMGNTVIWKPSIMQALSAHYTMELLREAGLPPGVINLLHGDGATVANAAIGHPSFAGLHFTGSSEVFSRLWCLIGNRMTRTSTYPRLVAETGGKGFVLAHPSADTEALVVALARGAFEYQGQKCSAASRAYIPRSLWGRVRTDIATIAEEIPMGNVADPRIFMGAVINEAALKRHAAAISA